MKKTNLKHRITELERDIMVLVLRLLGEDESTFAPETREVMYKWKEKASSLVVGRLPRERKDDDIYSNIKEWI